MTEVEMGMVYFEDRRSKADGPLGVEKGKVTASPLRAFRRDDPDDTLTFIQLN